jgi:hypothetical protein
MKTCDKCKAAGAGPLVPDRDRGSGVLRGLLCPGCKREVDQFTAFLDGLAILTADELEALGRADPAGYDRLVRAVRNTADKAERLARGRAVEHVVGGERWGVGRVAGQGRTTVS